MIKEQLKNISRNTIERYSNRLNKYGKDIKTLGWGTTEQQEYRFYNILMSLECTGKALVDIGCGFGDLFKYMENNNLPLKSYTGWDINDNLISQADNKDNPKVIYEVVDISDDLSLRANKFDIGIMLGLLNYNLNSAKLNYDYSKQLIKNAFTTVKEVLVVDFLSTLINENYPKEDFVFYHEPSKMLDFALSLSSNVVLKHNYAPIPQKEFMLFIYK